MQHLGLLRDKVEVTGNDGVPLMSADWWQKVAAKADEEAKANKP